MFSDGTAVGIMLYEERLFQVLETMKSLAYDGTFFVVPEPFYQLWTIFFIVGNQYFPAFSVLFLGKTTEMYDAAWSHIKELLPNFKPTTAGGDFEKAAANAAERQNPGLTVKYCLFHYDQADYKNSQKHGLTKAFYDNPEYKKWLKLILAVPMLPSHFINEAFTELLSREIHFPRGADQANFARYKRYIHRQWQRGVDPENLSCFGRDQACNNGPENFNGFVKREIKIHHSSFWTFIFHYNRILTHKYMEYKRLLQHGEGNVVRGRKKKTTENISKRRNAEVQLLQDGDWLAFLGRVSHTNDRLIDDLNQQFHNNGDQVDDPRIEVEIEANVYDVCVRCSLPIEIKWTMFPCGDTNVCARCISTLQSNPPAICPNADCGMEIIQAAQQRNRGN